MTKRKQDVPSAVRREAAQRTEGDREAGTNTLPALRSPMVRGREARRAALMAALVREGLVKDSQTRAD